MSAPPIACMLSGQDYKERLAWIADLNRTSLQTVDRADLGLMLTYDRRALGQVEELVEREQACCPFLSFSIQSNMQRVTLSITAPEEARDVAGDIFRAFIGPLEAPAKNAGCSCCGAVA